MSGRMWLSAADCSLDDLIAITEVGTSLSDYPWAAQVVNDVLLYSAPALRLTMADAKGRRGLQDELIRALTDGPGIVVFSGAFPDTDIVDAVSGVFDDIIDEQRCAGSALGDHFGTPGANDRIWNSLAKLAERAPDLFVQYYANDVIALVSQAWLGPSYQMTAQVNVVNPGGAAQQVHRDYHLGSQPDDVAERFPMHVHAMSPTLTLQGVIAHTDMPIESGPTIYVPHSQKYVPGYLAWRLPEFREHAEHHHVQLPLFKGDAVFFNPALFHAAGNNSTRTMRRMANLLQVSSAFGRAMESIDRCGLVLSIYDDLLKVRAEARDLRAVENVIAASAEGYAFPTNLDLDSPVGVLAPVTQASLLGQALEERWTHAQLAERLAEQLARRAP